MKNIINNTLHTPPRIRYVIFFVSALILIGFSSFYKLRTDEVNYLNSDATWHTLLTIKAYDETPVSDHLFLPIVSLGDASDKNIPWGATIPDKKGNYYYTSFSPAGYFAPWLFLKIFNMPATESSLYIFNSMLYILSTILWGVFLLIVYDRSQNRYALSFIGMLIYATAPEILHGMGIVYWHQSVMQVTLLLQMTAFVVMKKNNTASAKACFYAMTLINPYIEWTGYVANAGFALIELIAGRRDIKTAVRSAALIGLITAASFGVFCLHYLLRTDTAAFLHALKSRFAARNIASSARLIYLFDGYLKSFLYIWPLLLLLAAVNLAVSKRIELRHGLLMVMMAFPIIENLIMKEHAISYTFDRMKVIYLLSFLICELSATLMAETHRRKITAYGILILSAAAAILNYTAYINDKSYIWPADYRKKNETIAEYVIDNYPNSILGCKTAVRGYMNMLFQRGIYEGTDLEALKERIKGTNCRYAVSIDISDAKSGNIYEIGGATVYDKFTGNLVKVSSHEGKIFSNAVVEGVPVYQLANRTDDNWNGGCSGSSDLLLFTRDDALLVELLQGDYVQCNGDMHSIKKIDYDDQWIYASLNDNAKNCAYPNYIQIIRKK